jgi:rhodanese-related sulfurtransferase
MTEGQPDPNGTARTLRGVGVILLAGIVLGLGYNALGRASRPSRGLSWIGHEAKLRSLEQMEPAVDSAAAAAPAPSEGAPPAPRASAQSAHGSKPASPTSDSKPTAAPAPSPSPAPQSPPAPAVQSGLPQVPDSDEPIEVQLATVKKFFDAGAAVIVDAREAAEYAEGHIPGAMSLPYDDVAAKPQLLDAVRGVKKPIIVYCEGPGCDLSRSLAITMLSEGLRKVLVYTAGFPEWKAGGYPVERGGGGR